MASVLIVDDDANIRDILYDLFAEEHLCHTAETAEQALEWLKTGRYDVVLTDISMPGMSGLELVALIRQQQPGMPVVIITGIDYQEYAGDLMKLGAFDYVVKPFQLADARGKVTRAIEQHRQWLAEVEESAERAIEHRRRSLEEDPK
jgi:two-component system response regulator PilR (NtrC family)